MDVDLAKVDRAHLLACWTDDVEPVTAGGERSLDCWVENCSPPSGERGVPQPHDVFRRRAFQARALALLASLARPGGNITGLSNQTRDLAGKRVGLLREIAPDVHRLAIMTRIDNVSAASEMREVNAAADMLGIQVVPLEIRDADDIATAFEARRGVRMRFMSS